MLMDTSCLKIVTGIMDTGMVGGTKNIYEAYKCKFNIIVVDNNTNHFDNKSQYYQFGLLQHH